MVPVGTVLNCFWVTTCIRICTEDAHTVPGGKTVVAKNAPYMWCGFGSEYMGDFLDPDPLYNQSESGYTSLIRIHIWWPPGCGYAFMRYVSKRKHYGFTTTIIASHKQSQIFVIVYRLYFFILGAFWFCFYSRGSLSLPAEGSLGPPSTKSISQKGSVSYPYSFYSDSERIRIWNTAFLVCAMDFVEGGPREPFFPPSAGRDKEPWGYKQNKTYLHYLKKINFVHP